MQEETVLWLPGWGFQADVFATLVKAFPQETAFCCVSWQGLHATEDIVNRTKTLLNAVEGKVFIVGWSLGAMAALELACACPDKISRLALFAPTGSFIKRESYEHGWDARIVKRMKKQLQRDVEQVLGDFDVAMLGKAEHRDYLQKVQAIRSPDQAQSLATGLEYLLETDLRKSLKEIRQPMLLIHGSEDSICPEAASLYVEKHVPGEVKRIVLDGAGHIPFITEEDRVIRELGQFYLG